MNVVTVRFEEIHQVRRIRANRALPQRTVFGFSDGIGYTPQVTAPGFPRLEPGMTVHAVLREPGNWNTLVGWRDPGTNELMAPNPSWHLKGIVFFAVWGVIAVATTLPFQTTHSWAPFVAGALAGLACVSEATKWRLKERERRAIEELLPASHDA
ncbi:hypothetical protein [Niveibacterium sp. COAC-50]|uniref:hypothetical protein n=1 Tax=Niveibacterium sp. COAC-50 TaxID=2729384 RepID=UPI0015533CDC|nr:hypothetical protein [Niveibacterium sp. COAC-50]